MEDNKDSNEENNINNDNKIKDNIKIKQEEESENSQNKEYDQESEEEIDKKNNINEKSESNSEDSCSSCSEGEEEEKEKVGEDPESSSDFDVDEDRLTLLQVKSYLLKKRSRKEKENSLTLRTLRRNPQAIVYDSKTGKIQNSFCPSVDELSSFLEKCKVEEINLNKKAPPCEFNPGNIFDSEKFIKENNITKNSLSMEDLTMCPKKGQKIPELPKEIIEKRPSLIKPLMGQDEYKNKIIFKYISKEEKKRSYDEYVSIRKILTSKVLNQEQKKWLADYIKYVNNLEIKEIIDRNKTNELNKINIVLDLDNTCMFSFINKNEPRAIINRFPEKGIKLLKFTHGGNYIFSSVIIRKGLREFVQYVKDICTFHISTLGVESYGLEIVKLLEKVLEVEFVGFKARTEDKQNKKILKDIEVNSKDSIIFDDSVAVWEEESFNVIVSKKFVDKDCWIYSRPDNKKTFFKSNLEHFLSNFAPYSYNKFYQEPKHKEDINNKELKDNINSKEPKEKDDMNWKNQKINLRPNCPFYQYKNESDKNYNECYNAENLNSSKKQFIYMKNVIKVIYCLFMHNDVPIPEAIKLVRLNALNGKNFYLKYLTDEQKEILADVIKVCGGNIILNESNVPDSEIIFVVCSKQRYSYLKNPIIKEINDHKNYYLINERFILDSYYFMTDLEGNYRDIEYSFTQDDYKI